MRSKSKFLADIEEDHRIMAATRPRCTLARFLKKQDPGEAAEVLKVLSDPDSEISVAATLRVLRRRGYKGSLTTLHYHRIKACISCSVYKYSTCKGRP